VSFSFPVLHPKPEISWAFLKDLTALPRFSKASKPVLKRRPYSLFFRIVRPPVVSVPVLGNQRHDYRFFLKGLF
jgi:hypothetical protein